MCCSFIRKVSLFAISIFPSTPPPSPSKSHHTSWPPADRHKEKCNTFDAPARTPRIPDDEALLGFVIADGEHGVAAELSFGAAIRHGDDSGAEDGFRFEAFIHRETEDKGITGGQTAFQLRKDGRQALVAQGMLFQVGVVAFLAVWRQIWDDIGPRGFGRGALFYETP